MAETSQFDIYEAPELGGTGSPGNSPGRFQVIVRLEKGLPQPALAGIAKAQGGRIENLILSETSEIAGGKGSVYVLSFPDTPARQAIVNALSHRPGIELAELDPTATALLTSTDTQYAGGAMWGMYGPTGDGIGSYGNAFGSHADVAWARADISANGRVGSMRTVVGVIDSGIDPLHPDLYLNIWINQREIPGGLASDMDGDGIITFRDLNVMVSGSYVNTVTDVNGNGRIDADDILRMPAWANGDDDDANGRTDDLFGWDFYDNDNRPFEAYRGGNSGVAEPADSYHGTHVSGTIGALANGTGVVGVNWDVQIMPLRFLGPNGGFVSDAVDALYYYTAMGQSHPSLEFVGTNNSWGGGGYSSFLASAIRTAGDQGHLFVAAAGNETANNDVTDHYPSNYAVSSTFQGVTYDPVISVASIASNGALSSFSNWGFNRVDLAAPGTTIASTFAGNLWFSPPNYSYANASGTSMAAPHVTGAAALIASEYPGLHPADLKAAILGGATATTSLSGRVATGGRLNIPGAIAKVGPAPTITINDPLQTLADPAATVTFTFAQAVSGFTAADISVSAGHGAVSNLTSANNIVWTATFTPANVETGAAHVFVGNRFTSTASQFGREGQSLPFAIDRIAPAVTVQTIAATKDGTGANVDGTLSAALGLGDLLKVYRGGALLGNAAVTATSWHFDDNTALADGTYQYTARVVDAAANPGALSSQAGLQVVSTDFSLTPGVAHTGVHGRNFSGTSDADGTVTAGFSGTPHDLVLKLDGFDVSTATEVRVLLNGTGIGYLWTGPANTLAPSQFTIPAASQQPGTNVLTFMTGTPASTWGLTNVTLAAAPAADFALTPGVANTASWGRNFNGTNDLDGLVSASFAGTSQALMLTLKGYDLVSATDVKVLLNGAQLGYLAPTPVNSLGNSSFLVPAAAQLPGDNVLTFASKGATWTWGVTDVMIV